MLRVPDVIVDVAPPGLLRKDAEKALDLFRDPQRAGVILVTLAEDMPTRETLELDRALREELRMPVARLVVNGVLPRIFDVGEREALASLVQKLTPESPLYDLSHAGRARALRESMQEESITRLRTHLDVPRTELPQLLTGELRRDAIEALSRAF